MTDMIAYLEGKILEIEIEQKRLGRLAVVVGSEVGNRVGYQVYISGRDLDAAVVGQTIQLFTYHHFTESNQELYGFINKQELPIFKKLLGVSGVGPKVAMNVLSEYDHQELHEIISTKDSSSLQKVPGLGAKTAAKIIVQLVSDKNFAKLFESLQENGTTVNPQLGLLRQTLLQLSYNQNDIDAMIQKQQETINKAVRDNKDVSQLLQIVLQE